MSTGHVVCDAMLDPNESALGSRVAPWVKGGVVVAAIGVIGYALAQIATITGAFKNEGTRRHA